ncbi:Fungal transcriptional regulatory protein [Beauveria brongniartii RCEF 3172]|uniref:Fungal transcriptional regulatory protein n=1 Tax=Beauveria brongniartii RCEF 3172 TaxID=1081107 RepID=A0A162JLZ4_9HYPO|nr:Fungal transcriptional regulatory protein [Beauveria brongniartii RCEF 3172]
MSMFRRGPGVTWNSYLTKSCESIAALCQHPLDEALAASVRLQRIAQRGLSALPGTEYVWGPSATVYSHAQEMTLSLTRDNMDKFVHSQTPVIQNDVMFRHLYLALLVRLYEPVLGMQPAVSSPSDNSTNSTARAPFHRTDMLWKLVDACRALFAARAALTDAQTALRPSTMTGFLAFGVVTASRVLFHEAEDWQPSVARRRFDYGAAMRDAAAQYEAAEAWARSAGRRCPMHDKGPLLLLYANKLRWISQWYEARTVADDLVAAAGGGGDGGAAAEAAMITPPEDTPGQEAAVDSASLAGIDMMATDQQPMPGFLPDFQFDEAFWQDMLLGTPQPAFGQYNMGNGTL